MKQIIEIPMLPPRALNPNGGAHWATKRKIAEPLKQAIALESKRLEPVKGKVLITITFVTAQIRRRDGDNWLASMKPLIDTLVKTGFLPDDDSASVSYAPVQFRVDKAQAPKTILEVMEEVVA
jgi:Holliday junction resolvase RusA-like endonuclease